MDNGLSVVYKREENKKRLFSYAMAMQDIRIVKKYLEILQNENLDGDLKQANIIALHVIYGRIFGKNFDLPKVNMQELKCQLTEDEQNLHSSLINCRDKIFAHRDLSMNKLQVNLDANGKLIAIPTYKTVLIEQYYGIACSLFNKILNAIDKIINELLQKLYAQEDGYKIASPNQYWVIGCNNNLWECLYEQIGS